MWPWQSLSMEVVVGGGVTLPSPPPNTQHPPARLCRVKGGWGGSSHTSLEPPQLYIYRADPSAESNQPPPHPALSACSHSTVIFLPPQPERQTGTPPSPPIPPPNPRDHFNMKDLGVGFWRGGGVSPPFPSLLYQKRPQPPPPPPLLSPPIFYRVPPPVQLPPPPLVLCRGSPPPFLSPESLQQALLMGTKRGGGGKEKRQ